MTDPIDRPDFNERTAREPNPDTVARLRDLAKERDLAFAALREVIGRIEEGARDAFAKGHSIRQIARELEVSPATVQRML